MGMRAVALVLCLALTACFPNNAKHRTYAKLVEGGLLATGIILLAVSNTGADCDIGLGKPECKSRQSFVGGIGLSLILGGLVGFAATVTTAIDDKPANTLTPVTPTPATTPPPSAPSTAPTPIAQ